MKLLAPLALLALLLDLAPAAAQSRDIAPRPDAAPARSAVYANSWALVIGINAYQRAPRLNYAVADARSMAEALPELGFPRANIRTLLDGDATKSRIEAVLYEDFAAMGSEDRLLVFFAGHGETAPIKGGEEGYLLPVDANPLALARTAIPMDDLKRIGQRVRAKHVLFVMDACFSGFALTRDATPARTTDEYLSAALREPVVQVLTAGRKGERAIEEGGHGLFTRRLLDGIRGLADPEGRGLVTAAQLAAWIEPRVVRDSKGKMTPQYGKLDGEGQFVFVRPAAVAARPPADPPRPRVAEEARPETGSLVVSAGQAGVEVWLGEQKLGETRPGRVLVVSDLPAGSYRVRALKTGYAPWEREVRLSGSDKVEVRIDLEARPAGTAVAALPPSLPVPAGAVARPLGGDRASMVFIPAGPFLMGAGEEDARATAAERPQRTITLSRFWIDQYEVTNAQYRLFREATRHPASTVARDPRFNGPTQPGVGVSWEDAAAYCRWAAKRLPTEAEWEKAARGTDGRRFPWGSALADAGNPVHLGGSQTATVGSYASGASPYGVHDMAGNVWEWVQDWYDPGFYRKDTMLTNPRGPAVGGEKVLRGGSWWERDPAAARVTARHHQPPERTHNNVGFRCALSGGEDVGR